MIERTVLFGAHNGLVGILTEPDTPASGPRRAVVVSNIGMHHRAGPFRLYVSLARRLASSGLYVLRFDHAGMGDSVPRVDGATPAERAALDLDEAMDWLVSNAGIEEFLLVGLCSGVDSSHAAAVRDPRVRGAVFIDGYTYPTTGYFVRHYTLRYMKVGRWVRFARRLARGDSRAATSTAEATVFERDIPSHDEFRRDIATLTARGTRLFFVYTGGMGHVFNAPGQIFEMLGPGARRDGIEVEMMPKANHVFTSTAQREHILDRIDAWARSIGA